MTCSPLAGATLPRCSLRRALVSSACGGGWVIRGRLVSWSPSRICCLASLRTRARSAWGASAGPPQEGHADPATCAHTSAHSSPSWSWTLGSPMVLVNGPGSGRGLGGPVLLLLGLAVWRPMRRARRLQLAVPHLPLAKGRATCPLLPGTQEGRQWVVQWVAMFSADCQFDPRSSRLATDRGLSGASSLGLPHLVVSRQTYPLSPGIGQLCCPSGPCRGWRFPPGAQVSPSRPGHGA